MLLVDDDPFVLRFLENLLQARGCEVVSFQPAAGDEARCAAAAAAFRPDLLLVDKQMPIDPAGVVEAVRRSSARARVIMCTGTVVSPEDKERIGVDDVLAKPFTPSDLDRALDRGGAITGGTPSP